jgi:signal transduction histidine kinase
LTGLLSSFGTHKGLAADALRTIAQVRALTVEQTWQKPPVQLHGVVTFFDESWFSHFIQDETAGIYLQFPTNNPLPMLVPGERVEVAGIASAGEYAPVVLVSEVKVTGKGRFPEAKPVSYEQLAGGSEDSQWVEISGIARSARPIPGLPYHEVEIATGGGRLVVYVRDLPADRALELPDSAVRARGVCSTQFNRQRQLFSIRLMTSRADDLKIETPSSKDPFAIASRPIGSLLQFTPTQRSGHRVKVAGTVIYFEPGTALFLQDGDQGVEIQTRERGPLSLGDRVEALGFVSQGDYTPLLQDGVYRKIGESSPPPPVRLSVAEALKGNNDCQLIQVAARLIDRARHGSEQSLILQESNFIFQATLKQPDGPNAFGQLENGSRVSVAGMCRIEPGEWHAGEAWRAKSFSVLLRSAEDVAVLQPPPWWTLKKVLWMACALGVVALGAFGWVLELRVKVAERTRELETQIQHRQMAERHREVEQERARLAHDLHDELGAGLTEVNMLTTLVKSPTTPLQERDRYLGQLNQTAQRMVGELDEIVWAVNPRNDTLASLVGYFGSYAQRLLEIASVSCGLDIPPESPEHPLDPKFRQEIFLAFKEALTNIVRHAKATKVWLRIAVTDATGARPSSGAATPEYSDHPAQLAAPEHGRASPCPALNGTKYLVVEVTDDGCGFDAATRTAGHDGIANMHERLKSLGGGCEITSDAKRGTTVRFRAPLPENAL